MAPEKSLNFGCIGARRQASRQTFCISHMKCTAVIQARSFLPTLCRLLLHVNSYNRDTLLTTALPRYKDGLLSLSLSRAACHPLGVHGAREGAFNLT